MFVQVITMAVPADSISQLRALVSEEYLPAIRARPGFISANLLEQIDDPNTSMLVIYWQNQQAVENVAVTGVLSGSVDSIAARLPGLRIRRQSYVVNVTIDNRAPAATV